MGGGAKSLVAFGPQRRSNLRRGPQHDLAHDFRERGIQRTRHRRAVVARRRSARRKDFSGADPPGQIGELRRHLDEDGPAGGVELEPADVGAQIVVGDPTRFDRADDMGVEKARDQPRLNESRQLSRPLRAAEIGDLVGAEAHHDPVGSDRRHGLWLVDRDLAAARPRFEAALNHAEVIGRGRSGGASAKKARGGARQRPRPAPPRAPRRAEPSVHRPAHVANARP